MTSALLVNSSGLTLAKFSSPSSSSSSSSPSPSSSTISLPSRFPSGLPLSASAPSGNTFVWPSSPSASTIWEYDARGKRVGEISSPSGVDAVAAFERGVAVASSGTVKVYRRGEGMGNKRWVVAHTLATGPVNAMDAGHGVLVVAGEEVQAFALESGVRLDLPSVDVIMPIETVRMVNSSFPAFLVPTPSGLARVNLTGSVTDIPLPLLGHITDVAVYGERELVAVAGSAGVTFIDANNSATTVEMDDAAGVAFISPSTVAVRSTSGAVFLLDVESHAVTATEHKDVLAIHTATAPRTRPRSVSDKPILGERTNLNLHKKAVGFDKRTVSAPAEPSSAASTVRIRPASGHPVHHGHQDPDTTISTVAPTPLTGRERPSHRARRPRGSISSLNFVREEVDEAEESTPESITTPPPGVGMGSETVEELRRDIANLQIDMLRMARGLKNEIRAAVGPLVDELRANRETIAAQRAEIERLRRGY